MSVTWLVGLTTGFTEGWFWWAGFNSVVVVVFLMICTFCLILLLFWCSPLLLFLLCGCLFAVYDWLFMCLRCLLIVFRV